MNENSSQPVANWRKLYKAALFETDASKLPSRIEEAERALKLRARELFATRNSQSHEEETEAIDDALYALHALENCVKLNTRDRRVIPRTGSRFSAE